MSNPFSFYVQVWGGKDSSDGSWWTDLCVGDRPKDSYPETDTIIFSARFNARDWTDPYAVAMEHAHLLRDSLGLIEFKEGL